MTFRDNKTYVLICRCVGDKLIRYNYEKAISKKSKTA